jgi:putative hemolysin
MRVRTVLWLAVALGAAACTTTTAERPASTGAAIGMANPASVNCTQRGGKLQLVSTPAGQTGICTFPSGKQCEEWALMRGQCTPG